jgi:hypothetical protein
MRELRHGRQQLRLDVLPRHQQLDRLDPGRLDEILPFDDEEAELVPPAPVAELADELQPLVVA